jgi:glycerophosphoryl diester phosphodiesterase
VTDARTGIARRTLLGGGLAALVGAAGCQRLAADPLPAAPGLSARTLLATPPFFVGWRGGSRDWPEMTTYGFEQAAAIPGILAMELVVAQTADSVLVCSADPTTQRVTGLDFTVAEETWATLSGLKVRANETKDPQQPARPLARLEDIIDQFIDRFVFFVEPQAGTAAGNLMAKLISLDAPGRIVWKQAINSDRFGEAKLHGFSTFGYVLDEPAHTGENLERLAQSDDLDMIGVAISHPKKLLSSVLDAAQQNGLRPVTWKVGGRAELERALDLGFEGIGSPAIREIIAMKR